MQRVAFIRSIEIQQTAPYLNQLASRLKAEGIEARLFYTDGGCTSDDFPGSFEKIPSDISPSLLAELLSAWGADAAVSLSIADENALRDAVLKDLLAERGIPIAMHSWQATVLFANKWSTKQLVTSYGLKTPPGVLLDGDCLNNRNLPILAFGDVVALQAETIGYPQLAKPLWDCLGNGMRFLENEEALREFLQFPYDGNVILEQCRVGELCSVEIVGTAGSYIFQPLLWKGRTGGAPSFAFDTIRHCVPDSGKQAAFEPVAQGLRRICGDLDLSGALEIEMIYSAGTYEIIEVNPRVSGSTTLSIAASDCNTYECLMDIALGKWGAERSRALEAHRRIAIQFPALTLDKNVLEAAKSILPIVRASEFHISGRRFANVVTTCEFESVGEFVDGVHHLANRFGFVSSGTLSGLRQALEVDRALPPAACA